MHAACYCWHRKVGFRAWLHVHVYGMMPCMDARNRTCIQSNHSGHPLSDRLALFSISTSTNRKQSKIESDNQNSLRTQVCFRLHEIIIVHSMILLGADSPASALPTSPAETFLFRFSQEVLINTEKQVKGRKISTSPSKQPSFLNFLRKTNAHVFML